MIDTKFKTRHNKTHINGNLTYYKRRKSYIKISIGSWKYDNIVIECYEEKNSYLWIQKERNSNRANTYKELTQKLNV